MIEYMTKVDSISMDSLNGFFVGWPNPPSNEVFLKMLINSYRCIIAVDNGKVVGFINAISDGVLSAYMPLLEVLPDYQGQKIGQELLRRMVEELKDLYMIDLLCDENLVPFYEKLGLMKSYGACIRNYQNQSGSS